MNGPVLDINNNHNITITLSHNIILSFIVSGCAGFWGFHFLALRELVGSERVRKARA